MSEFLDIVRATIQKEEILMRKEIRKEDIIDQINGVICEAVELIETDIFHEFLYKNPQKMEPAFHFKKPIVQIELQKIGSNSEFSEANYTTTSESSSSLPPYPWPFIKYFTYDEAVNQIRNFIETWNLTAITKFAIIRSERIVDIPLYGKRYFVEAHFSKPTPKCPNPLAVAKIYFNINVSSRLPPFYPIMVTYKFENCRTMYYALGEKQMASNKFQRYFIDAILHMKLSFYKELWECRNPMRAKRSVTKTLNTEKE